jgi:hypothetical protein
VPPGEFTAALAAAIQGQLDANPSPTRLLRAVAGVGPYLNLFLNRATVYRLTMRCGVALHAANCFAPLTRHPARCVSRNSAARWPG